MYFSSLAFFGKTSLNEFDCFCVSPDVPCPIRFLQVFRNLGHQKNGKFYNFGHFSNLDSFSDSATLRIRTIDKVSYRQSSTRISIFSFFLFKENTLDTIFLVVSSLGPELWLRQVIFYLELLVIEVQKPIPF